MIIHSEAPSLVATDDEHKTKIQNMLKEEYNFYIRVQRVLMKNNRSFMLIRQVQEIIADLSYNYNNIKIPPISK